MIKSILNKNNVNTPLEDNEKEVYRPRQSKSKLIIDTSIFLLIAYAYYSLLTTNKDFDGNTLAIIIMTFIF